MKAGTVLTAQSLMAHWDIHAGVSGVSLQRGGPSWLSISVSGCAGLGDSRGRAGSGYPLGCGTDF